MGKRYEQLLKDGGPAPLFDMAIGIKELWPKMTNAVHRDLVDRFESVLEYLAFEDNQP